MYWRTYSSDSSLEAMANESVDRPPDRPKKQVQRMAPVYGVDCETRVCNEYYPPFPEKSCFKRMVRMIGREFLSQQWERKYYADRYSCCPPPLFIPLITILQLSSFVYYCLDSKDISTSGPVPESPLIYSPDRRDEVWRFFTYSLLHAGWVHLFFNLVIQIIVGLPLEMVHGSCRIAIIYVTGVLAGSLGTSVFDSNAMLVGASGGVYALLAAHVSNVVLNFDQMEMGILRIIAVILIASTDVGFAVYNRYMNSGNGLSTPGISYVAHVIGALAGLNIGLVVLKNFEQKLYQQLVWWVALGIYTACILFAILYNIFE